MISYPTLKTLIHLKLIFANSVSEGSSFIALYVAVQFSHYHLLKWLSPLHSLGFFVINLSTVYVRAYFWVCMIGILILISLNLYIDLGNMDFFNNSTSSNTRAWNIFTCICLFKLIYQNLTLQYTDLSLLWLNLLLDLIPLFAILVYVIDF